jgi:hypothetical protein
MIKFKYENIKKSDAGHAKHLSYTKKIIITPSKSHETIPLTAATGPNKFWSVETKCTDTTERGVASSFFLFLRYRYLDQKKFKIKII